MAHSLRRSNRHCTCTGSTSCLVLTSRPQERVPQRIDLCSRCEPRVTLGRAVPPGTGRVVDDVYLSRQHVVLDFSALGWSVQDLNSKNGSKINDRRLNSSCLISPGDTLQLGLNVKYLFQDLVAESDPMAALLSDQMIDFAEGEDTFEEDTGPVGGKRRSRDDDQVQCLGQQSKRSRPQVVSAPIVVDLTGDDTDTLAPPVTEPAKFAKIAATLPLEAAQKALADTADDLCCCICQSLIVGASVLPCGHAFCGSCINEWLRRNRVCPNCREPASHAAPIFVLDKITERLCKECLSTEDAADYDSRLAAWRRSAPTARPHRPDNLRESSYSVAFLGGISPNYSDLLRQLVNRAALRSRRR